LPTGGQVVGGQAGISQSGAAMRIDQSSARAAIDWQSFNIGAGASVTFNQPSSSAIALNRVLGSSGSEIYGRLSANGQVFLINPNGVLFGRGAQVDVGGLVASTLGMSADDFMLGRYSLRGSAAGSVVNQGTIRAPDGSVALIAPNVTNDGLIEAQHGAIALTAASAATVDFLADGLVRIRVDDGALQAEIANNGVLRADGGTITLTAKSLDNLARAVVNNTGIIEARTVEDVNGVVRLAGGDVYVSGTIDVSSADGVGGSAHVLGERVALLGNARIDASGALGGGEVLIGGDRGGRNPEIQNAAHVHIGADATVRADALTEGHGGTVIAWSDEVTRVYGNLSVRGGAGGGDGGFVETSSKRYLDVQQAPDLRAPAGRAGTWLLDPETINIENAADFNITASTLRSRRLRGRIRRCSFWRTTTSTSTRTSLRRTTP
jgi:filamentous hemagglutinin family protein